MSQRPVKRLKGSPTTHRIPFDILCLIAQAGGDELALDLATLCRAMKRRIDERYEVTKQVDVEDIAEFWGRRRPCVVGKYISVRATSGCDYHQVPDSVRELVLSGDFSTEKPSELRLPPGLVKLSIECEFHGPVSGFSFPESLQHLTIMGDLERTGFNEPVSRLKLPSNLKSLTFGYYFDRSVAKLILPSSLESLAFGRHFTKSLSDLKLPNGLKTLYLGGCFNQTMDRVKLPESLEELHFGFSFNRSLDNVKLPDNLRELLFGDNFDRPLENVKLPVGLRKLHFRKWFNSSLQSVKLPDNLQDLRFGEKFNQPVGQLPQGLLVLHFDKGFNQPLKLPPHLRTLKIPSDSVEIVGDIPESLKQVVCGCKNTKLKDKLKTLKFYSRGSDCSSFLHYVCCFQRS